MKHTMESRKITHTAKEIFRTITRKAAKFRSKYLQQSGQDGYDRMILSTNEEIILLREWMDIITGSIIR